MTNIDILNETKKNVLFKKSVILSKYI